MSLMDHLRPTEDQIECLALRETDPAYCDEFEPITKGPLIAVAIISLVGIAAMIVSPFRIAIRVMSHDGK